MKKLRIASIDIGSNSVILLITEYDLITRELNIISNHYRTPRLSEGVINTKRISQAKIFLLINILEEFKKISKEHGCDLILATGTYVFRNADNAQEIIDLVKNKSGIQIEILSGEEEAYLSFIGSAFSENENSSKLIIDIGGGSTELIVGNESDGIIFRKSNNIGVVTLYDRFISTYPPTQEIIAEIKREIITVFNPVIEILPRFDSIIAVAGTPTTLACIKLNLKAFEERLIDGVHLSKFDIQAIINSISTMNKEKVFEEYGEVVKGREDLLLTGSLILLSLLELVNKDTVTVSTRGLRYGTILKRLEKMDYKISAIK
ncbi:MAG: hypothetical protein RBS48_08365 [Ignavibacteriaceae bacterium]|jgi:exopolyphosphatase/guanosine-5'-triphosphate,3'-diphosphate pyrophosphatase|nr:hypothetical protein [Ignavibacteriaceae bacterium]